MPRITDASPGINANFALTVINRAAELIADAATRAELDGSVVGAFQQARDEFLAAETRQQKSGRTYGLPRLLKDLGEFVKSRYPEHAASFTPVSDWNDVTSPGVMAQTLREAALALSRVVEERTIWSNWFEAMTPKESAEYELMGKAAAFLTQQGMVVSVAWDREDANDPIDYRATIDGTEWAFELTELRIDAEGSHLSIGYPKERKSVKEQLEELAGPLVQIPDGPDTLQKALHNAAKHGSKASKIKELNGARYCLVLHNRQFLSAAAWKEITLPNLMVFDAVLALHQESYPPGQTWQVFRNGFGKPMRSNDVSDLGDMIIFRNSNRMRRSDPVRVKAALRHLEALELTEEDVRAAIAETRAERHAQ